jgi:hypothetical protein
VEAIVAKKETYKASTEDEDRYQKNVASGKERWSLSKQNALATARQQRDLERANRMLEEGPPKGIGADEVKKRLGFMTDAMYQDRKQRELDAEIADKPKREAANELRRESRGVQPTPKKDRADMATHNYYKGFDKPLFGGKEGLPIPGMKKGGAVKSASSRADGIAQRGKTRGMMR